MSIFSWFKMKPSKDETSSKREACGDDIEPTEKEAFQSAELLAGWTNRYLLEAIPLENNYQYLPDVQSRKDLNITFEQRERYIREIPILRIAGVSLFVKQYYDDDFWLQFSRAVYPFLYRHLFGEDFTKKQLTELAIAIEKYVSYAEDDDEKETSLHYMHRVYDDSDNFMKLLTGGVGFLSVQWLMDTYEIFRDAYFTVTQGMPYESYKTLLEAMDKIDSVKA